LGHVKDPSSCSSLRTAGKIRMFSFLPSLIEASRAAWCGVPLGMKEGTIPIRGTKGLSTRPRCITLITQLDSTRLLELLFLCPVSLSVSQYTKIKLETRKKTRIFNLKRIRAITTKIVIRVRIIPQSLLQVLHIALTAVDTVHTGRTAK
jgi:hypothetical protein